MNARSIRACAALLLVGMAPLALAQRATTPSIAVGEPDPNARHLPAHPGAQAKIDAIFKAWDRDRNGSLSNQEFSAGYLNLRRIGEVTGRLRHQFNSVDGNKNGAIDASEYGNLLLVKQAGTSAPPLSAFDANKNQRLEFAEYLALVRRMSARQTTVPAAPGHKP